MMMSRELNQILFLNLKSPWYRRRPEKQGTCYVRWSFYLGKHWFILIIACSLTWRLCINLFSRTIYMKIIKFRLSDDVKVERKWRNCIVFPQVLYLLQLFPLTFCRRHREIMLFSCKDMSRAYLDTRLHTHSHAGMFLKDMQKMKNQLYDTNGTKPLR